MCAGTCIVHTCKSWNLAGRILDLERVVIPTSMVVGVACPERTLSLHVCFVHALSPLRSTTPWCALCSCSPEVLGYSVLRLAHYRFPIPSCILVAWSEASPLQISEQAENPEKAEEPQKLEDEPAKKQAKKMKKKRRASLQVRVLPV